jgi:hypothetical protein
VKLIQKSIIYSLIGLIFFGSVGVSVFSHFCSIKGTDYSFFVKKEDSCKIKVSNQVKIESCCHKKVQESNEKISSEKCCKEEMSVYKLNTENYSKILKLKQHVKYYKSFSYFSELFPTIFSKEEQIAQNENGPPIKSGKKIIIENQVFRI